MKQRDLFNSALFLTLLLVILIASLVSYCAESEADEVKQEPAKVADCSYVPKPSDEVYYTCSEGAIGMVEVKLWICGQPYTINAKCPK